MSNVRELLVSKAYDKVKTQTGKNLERMFKMLSVRRDPDVNI